MYLETHLRKLRLWARCGELFQSNFQISPLTNEIICFLWVKVWIMALAVARVPSDTFCIVIISPTFLCRNQLKALNAACKHSTNANLPDLLFHVWLCRGHGLPLLPQPWDLFLDSLSVLLLHFSFIVSYSRNTISILHIVYCISTISSASGRLI